MNQFNVNLTRTVINNITIWSGSIIRLREVRNSNNEIGFIGNGESEGRMSRIEAINEILQQARGIDFQINNVFFNGMRINSLELLEFILNQE